MTQRRIDLPSYCVDRYYLVQTDFPTVWGSIRITQNADPKGRRSIS